MASHSRGGREYVRSSNAVVIFTSPKTRDHSAKSRFVVIMTLWIRTTWRAEPIFGQENHSLAEKPARVASNSHRLTILTAEEIDDPQG